MLTARVRWQIFTEMRERVDLAIQARMEALLAEVDEVGLAKDAALQSQQLCLAQCLAHLYGAQEAVAALGLRDDIAIVALQGPSVDCLPVVVD